MQQKVIVRVMRHFEATREQVFDAWLDPDTARKFLFASPDGHMVRADIEPFVGGTFRITDHRGNEDVDHVGTYIEISRPRRLVFSLSLPKLKAVSTRVTIDLTVQDRGCEVALTHDGVPANFAGQMEESWNQILYVLAHTLFYG